MKKLLYFIIFLGGGGVQLWVGDIQGFHLLYILVRISQDVLMPVMNCVANTFNLILIIPEG